MMNRGRLFVSVSILSFGALIASSVAPRPAGAVAASLVQVVNTSSSAIPVNGTVEVSGAVNTNITNSTLPVNGTVTITGTPSVSLNQGSTITVSNDKTQSVPTKDVENGTLNAVSLSCSNLVKATGSPTFSTQSACVDTTTMNPFITPQGMRLVIDHVSGVVEVSSSGGISDAGLLLNRGGNTQGLYAAAIQQSTLFGVTHYAFSIRVHAVGDSGGQVAFFIDGSSPNAAANATAYVEGHLVDCSAGCAAN